MPRTTLYIYIYIVKINLPPLTLRLESLEYEKMQISKSRKQDDFTTEISRIFTIFRVRILESNLCSSMLRILSRRQTSLIHTEIGNYVGQCINVHSSKDCDFHKVVEQHILHCGIKIKL